MLNKTYTNTRTNQTGTVIAVTADSVTLNFDGTTKEVKLTTLKRWYKEVEVTTPAPATLTETMYRLADELGCTIFTGTAPNFYSVKYKGKMLVNFTSSKKGITLWLRENVAWDMALNFRTVQHMFSARFTILNPETTLAEAGTDTLLKAILANHIIAVNNKKMAKVVC